MADTKKSKKAPAKSIKAREEQLVAATFDLAEDQILAGTASSQVMTHFLKIGATTYELELERLKNENELLKAKVEALKSSRNFESLVKEAIDAMQRYGGNPSSQRKTDE